MKALFLDIDGVLNSESWVSARPPRPAGDGLAVDVWHLDPAAVARLRRVVDATGVRLVLSSDWRRAPWKPGLLRTSAALRRVGLGVGLAGATPVLTGAQRDERFTPAWVDGRLFGSWHGRAGWVGIPRWMECQVWLDTHPEVTRWAVVDDAADFDAPGWREKHVQTDADVGLTDADADRLIALLTESP